MSDPKYSYILVEVKNMDPITPDNSEKEGVSMIYEKHNKFNQADEDMKK